MRVLGRRTPILHREVLSPSELVINGQLIDGIRLKRVRDPSAHGRFLSNR